MSKLQHISVTTKGYAEQLCSVFDEYHGSIDLRVNFPFYPILCISDTKYLHLKKKSSKLSILETLDHPFLMHECWARCEVMIEARKYQHDDMEWKRW
jgi:hypothetical protein